MLYGEHEAAFVRRHAAKLAAELPDVRVREVPDAGHTSNLDDPAFFTGALREFLERDVVRGESDGASDGRGENAFHDAPKSGRHGPRGPG